MDGPINYSDADGGQPVPRPRRAVLRQRPVRRASAADSTTALT